MGDFGFLKRSEPSLTLYLSAAIHHAEREREREREKKVGGTERHYRVGGEGA
jgi:hypothetical protein